MQRVEAISISDLHLRTENPRDPIWEDMSDIDIIKRALVENPKKRNIQDLIKNMWDFYHFNKLPIVVNKNWKFIVYDGNCRIAILKYVQNPWWAWEIEWTLFPSWAPKDFIDLKAIPCVICDEKTALEIIYHDNMRDNTRSPLSQSYFEYHHLNKPKNIFLMFEEVTWLISKNDKLNQRFVKEEVITEINLWSIWFKVIDWKMYSIYNDETSEKILNRLIDFINTWKISTRSSETSTRMSAGALGDFMKKEDDTLNIWEYSDEQWTEKNIKPHGEVKQSENNTSWLVVKKNKTKPTNPIDILFWKTLQLQGWPVNNLYCAICKIYERFQTDTHVLPIIGMSLRLILDLWAREYFKRVKEEPKDKNKPYVSFLIKAWDDMLLTIAHKTYFAITDSRLSKKHDLEAHLWNYAHYWTLYPQRDLINDSIIVWDIIEFYFWKNK